MLGPRMEVPNGLAGAVLWKGFVDIGGLHIAVSLSRVVSLRILAWFRGLFIASACSMSLTTLIDMLVKSAQAWLVRA